MRTKSILLAGVIAVAAFAQLGAHAAACTKKTASGTEKCAENGYSIHCGSEGKTPVDVGSVKTYVNQTDDGVQAEACNDQGSGTTRGALIVDVNTTDGYARVSLESTKEQEPNVDPGYINVQVGPGQGQTGVWCSKTGGSGTGYSRPVNSPGEEGGATPDKWVECIPNN
jgi:hypothetical protein